MFFLAPYTYNRKTKESELGLLLLPWASFMVTSLLWQIHLKMTFLFHLLWLLGNRSLLSTVRDFVGNLTRGMLAQWRICQDLISILLQQVKDVERWRGNLCLRKYKKAFGDHLCYPFIIVLGICYLGIYNLFYEVSAFPLLFINKPHKIHVYIASIRMLEKYNFMIEKLLILFSCIQIIVKAQHSHLILHILLT